MIEREKKYIVIAPKFEIKNIDNTIEGVDIFQTYINSENGVEERIRRISNRVTGKVKFTHTRKIDTEVIGEREEIEEEINFETYKELLKQGLYSLEKHRMVVNGWEIDLYLDINLVIAEVEYEDIRDIQDFPYDWQLLDVTGDKNFSNKNLAERFGM